MHSNKEIYETYKGGELTDPRAKLLYLTVMPESDIAYEALIGDVSAIQQAPSPGLIREIQNRLRNEYLLYEEDICKLNEHTALDILLEWLNNTGVFDQDVVEYKYAKQEQKPQLPLDQEEWRTVRQKLERILLASTPFEHTGRDLAFQLCFALRLTTRYDKDVQQPWESPAAMFLWKVCGFQFNARSDWEWVCYFCLYHKMEYRDAVKLYQDYLNAAAITGRTAGGDDDISRKEQTAADSMPTTSKITETIRSLFTQDIIESKALFYKTLYDNAEIFDGYCRTARRKFIQLRSEMTINYVLWAMEHGADQLSNAVRRKFLQHFLSDEQKRNRYKNKPCDTDMAELREAIDAKIRDQEQNGICFFAEFYPAANDILSNNRLLRVPLYSDSIKSDDDYNDLAKDMVGMISDFPRRQYLNKMGRDDYIAYKNPASRNTYLLLAILNEVYQKKGLLIENEEIYDTFDGFFKKLNVELFKCGYAMINIWQHFDWLLIKCYLVSLSRGAKEATKFYTQALMTISTIND